MKRPPELSPELNWCEQHGGWDPKVGAKMCGICAYHIAHEELGGMIYMLEPREVARYIDKVAAREPRHVVTIEFPNHESLEE